MTSLLHDTSTTTTPAGWIVSLQQELAQVLTFTATRPGLDEDAKLAIKRVLHQLPSDDVRAAFADCDPYLVEQLFAGAFGVAMALSEPDEAAARRTARVNLERARQALRDLLEEEPVGSDQPIKEVVRWLVEAAEVPQGEIATLLHTTTRTLQRWISTNDTAAPTREQATAVRTLARVLNQLRHTLTPSGTIAWLTRPHPALGGAAPRDLLAEPRSASRLLSAASAQRAPVAC